MASHSWQVRHFMMGVFMTVMQRSVIARGIEGAREASVDFLSECRSTPNYTMGLTRSELMIERRVYELRPFIYNHSYIKPRGRRGTTCVRNRAPRHACAQMRAGAFNANARDESNENTNAQHLNQMQMQMFTF